MVMVKNIRIPNLYRTMHKSIEDLNTYIDTHNSLHTSTKNILQTLCNELTDCIRTIKKVLDAEESPDTSNDIVNNLSDEIKDIKNIIAKMQTSSEQTIEQDNLTSINSNLNSVDVSVAQEKITNTKTVTTEIPLTIKSKDKKFKAQFYNDFRDVLDNLHNRNTGYKALDDVIDLYHTWYYRRVDMRFNKENGAKPLPCGINRISDTLYAFVILYGYHMEKGDAYKFSNDVNNFYSDLFNDRTKLESQLHPTEIIEFVKDKQCVNYTTSALILWDLLLDYGLQELCNKYGMYSDGPKTDGVETYFEKYAPDVLDEYMGIGDDDYLYDYGFERIGIN
jgi:hypothetical protein